MTPGTVVAITYLLAELIAAGLSMSQILADVKATGRVSDERWAEIISEMDKAEAAWR